MLPKIPSFPQQLIANSHASEAKVSERCGMSRMRNGAFLVLIFVVALQPSKSFSEAAFAFGQWGNGGWTYGSAYNHRTQSEAQIAAMNTCNQGVNRRPILTPDRRPILTLLSDKSGR